MKIGSQVTPHEDDPETVGNMMRSIGEAIATLPRDQRVRYIGPMEKLAEDPATIGSSYAAFSNINDLGERARPLLRKAFLSLNVALETAREKSTARLLRRNRRGYVTLLRELCRSARNGHADADFIGRLIDDGTIGGDLIALQAISFTDFSDNEKISKFQDNDYIFSRPPAQIIADYRTNKTSPQCR